MERGSGQDRKAKESILCKLKPVFVADVVFGSFEEANQRYLPQKDLTGIIFIY